MRTVVKADGIELSAHLWLNLDHDMRRKLNQLLHEPIQRRRAQEWMSNFPGGQWHDGRVRNTTRCGGVRILCMFLGCCLPARPFLSPDKVRLAWFRLELDALEILETESNDVRKYKHYEGMIMRYEHRSVPRF